MPLDLRSTVRLNNGVLMPRLGLGVYQLGAGRETRDAVRAALEVGYRLFDTAKLYGNEADVGEALRESGVPRDQLFVTTKLWNEDQGYDQALRAFDASLDRLRLEQIDLYLVHFPVPRLRRESWRALERILAEGRARAVGVSNYTVRHLEELYRDSRLVPAVNQIELSPFLQQRELVEHCRAHGIQVEAYAPLTAAHKLRDRRVAEIARRHGRTNAQILLRWSLEQGHVIIPKSRHPSRIDENARIFDFELSSADRLALGALDEGFRSSWDPTDVP